MAVPSGAGGGGGGSDFLADDASAALVITHVSGRAGIGTKLPIGATGLSLGGPDSDVPVEGAEASGTRLAIEWDGIKLANRTPGWTAVGTGKFWLKGTPAARAALTSGDDLRVVNDFFRFLSGAHLERSYYETIYDLTIKDFSTGLHNARYFKETLGSYLSRAIRHDLPLSVAALQFSRSSEAPTLASHDLMKDVIDQLRRHLPPDWLLARSDELELTIMAPDMPWKEAEQRLGSWLRPATQGTAVIRLGVAGSDPSDKTESLLARARAQGKRP